ncbi:MAG TPA: glycosyltransferase family 39 protein [Pseudomonadales bacterium]|nr:glycosyltransferase family 39 protein [Pseudomonadales bacterium]
MESFFKKLVARPQLSIICLGLLLLLAGNWILPLTDRDEARFGEASREMIQRHDYIVPWFNGQWRLYKPVGIYWCQIASYRVLGVSDFSARLPSVLFTIGTAVLLMRWGRKLADTKTGFLAGAMFLTCLHVVAVLGRIATADLALIFFFTLTTWAGWELTRPQQPARKKWWWTFYLALTLTFYAKGPEAVLPLVAMVLGRVLRKESFRLPVMETVAGLVLTLALIGAWGIPALQQTHGAFWKVGMNEQVYQRAVDINNGHGLHGIWGYLLPLPFYFLTFFASFLPWSTRVPGNLYRWWQRRKQDDLGWYLLMVAAVVFVAFTLVKTKLPHYTAPAFPMIALWLALQISGDAKVPVWFVRRLAVVVVIILTVTLGGFSFVRGHLLTLNVWEAARPYVKPETKVGCFGYFEPSLVWKFRDVVTNDLVLADERQAKNFLTNSPPFILVLPTKDLAELPDTNGLRIQVQGFDMVKFKNWDLTAIVRE